jgi:hypothetical protein
VPGAQSFHGRIGVSLKVSKENRQREGFNVIQRGDKPAINLRSSLEIRGYHLSRITWKIPRSNYVIQRKFLSQSSAAHARDSCLRWLTDEHAFAPTETIDSKCVQTGEERNGGTTLYSTLRTINQVDLE